ncbi:hypothetical protein POPTR_008G224328v4 [Populus trichocarpa]|uniref:Uncharacterized protein n=1 Tax=Populus trichocarpa TaxID=3694 RepID=A0A2K1ZLH6_POPTR|nr:hypothetical protein POPTR_008G224328v4 [Populus trichocarpa]
MAGVDTTRSQLNAGTPAARLPQPATSGWPLQRLASPPQGAGQNAGGQGPKAAPPRAREQASRGCRLPRPATSGWPLQRLASPPQGAGQNAGGQGPKAARDGEQASRGSPCFRQPSMAAGAAGRHARAPKRPSAQGPPRAPGPQAPAPSAGAGGRARARAWYFWAKGRRRPENGSSMPAKLRAMRPPTLNFSLPAAQVRTRISPPRQQANAAEADSAADTVPRAATAPVSKPAVFLVEPWTIQPVQTHRQHLLPILPISSALPIPPLPPAVSKPALFRQRVPWTNFPAWPGQSIVQPMFVDKSALPIFPHVGMAAAAPLSGPTVFSVKPWTVNHSSPAPAADSADFVGAADSTTAPAVSKPALFRQRVPWTNFPAWPGQSIVQPMFVDKSALPIFPHVGMAAAAPLSGPTVFSVKPWTVNRPDSELIASTCCRFCRFLANAAETDTAAESADTVPRAATAPVSKPAVFLVEPWTVQTHRQHLLPISSALPIPPLPPRV